MRGQSADSKHILNGHEIKAVSLVDRDAGAPYANTNRLTGPIMRVNKFPDKEEKNKTSMVS